MKEKIERLKQSVESSKDSHYHLLSAIDQMDQEVAGDLSLPGQDRIESTIDKTVAHFESEQTSEDGIISQYWTQLSETIEEWENDHPRLALAIGDIARALVAAGI